jgi:hypothetical protein
MAFHNDRTVLARRGMVCSVDHLASAAGVAVLRAGGNAADAAVTVPFTTPAGGAPPWTVRRVGSDADWAMAHPTVMPDLAAG